MTIRTRRTARLEQRWWSL